MNSSVVRCRGDLIIHGKRMRVVMQYLFPETVGLKFCSEITNTYPIKWFAECDISCYLRIPFYKILTGLRCVPF